MGKINRVILSGGGTGGHIYPALSIYRRLHEINPDTEFLYIGTETGLESEIVPREGIPFESINIQGLKRSLSLDNLKSVWLMLTSTTQSKRLIKEFKPDIVIGTGGYVCAPVVYAGSKLGIPTVIHEQNSVAGVTNKFLASYVDKIDICFPDVASDFSKYSDKITLTGNPRGQEVLNHPFDEAILQKQFNLVPDKPTVLIFGGSRGAPAINQAAVDSIPHWTGKDYQVIIATGRQHYDQITAELDENSKNIRVVPYIDDMPAVLKAIDLVVCRSGATTLTELTALGLPSILIPSPYVTNNHQEHNAMSLVNNQAALMIREQDLTSASLTEKIDALFDDRGQLDKMSNNAKALGIPNAIELIIETMEDIVV